MLATDIPFPGRIRSVSAKEQLMRRVLDLSEHEARVANIVIERTFDPEQRDIDRLIDTETDSLMADLAQEEANAGFGPWKT